MSTYTYSQDQPEAGPSKRLPSGGSNIINNGRNHNLSTNPQLSSEPWFAYPTPPPEVLDAELPPYMDSENYPMGHMLDRLARKAHGDLKTLVTETYVFLCYHQRADGSLPKLEPRQRPRQVINYATNTRQAVLKYLAVLRWKTQVDVPTVIPAEGPAQPQSAFPTPHSNGDSYSPNVGGIKGKGKMAEDIKPTMIRGKVTDAKRVTEYLQYQNSQHDMAIGHIQHAAKQLESLRQVLYFGCHDTGANETGSATQTCSQLYRSSRWALTTDSHPTSLKHSHPVNHSLMVRYLTLSVD